MRKRVYQGTVKGLVAIHIYEFCVFIGHIAKNISKMDFCEIAPPKPLYFKEQYMVFEKEYYNDWVDTVLIKVGKLNNSELYFYINNFEIDYKDVVLNIPTAADVKKLREETGCGMMDCKRALTRFNNDFDFAKEFIYSLSNNGRDRWCINRAMKKLGREPNIY